MKYSPRTIIFCAVSRYLDDPTYYRVLDHIGREYPKQGRKFLAILKKHFDFELMKDKPYIWQEIWIYNYLKYDYKGSKFARKELLAKYESEIVLPSEKYYKELSLIFNQ